MYRVDVENCFDMFYLSPGVQGVIIAINLLPMFCPSPGVQGGCYPSPGVQGVIIVGTGCIFISAANFLICLTCRPRYRVL